MAPSDAFPRNGFLEAMQMTRLPNNPPDSTTSHHSALQRFISHRPAWTPGGEMPKGALELMPGPLRPGAYGGYVFAQAPLAAARAIEEQDEKTLSNGAAKGRLGIHSIQGVFTKSGLVDRPFIYEVSDIASGRSFSARLVKARQPTRPSANPAGPFPVSDSSFPLGDVCFACITTFKRPIPSCADQQETVSAQQRYADILSLKAPHEWEPCPQLDIDIVKDAFPDAGHGGFPILDLHKVDMTGFNAHKPPTERRELIMYRLHKPLPTDDANAHILCHAFEADRNGLIMLGNHLGWGYSMGVAATLTYSFYVHVNADEAIMHSDRWWIQEVSWPRASAGRGMMESRIWSPDGKHVASGYQDGVIMPLINKPGINKPESKL